MASEDASMDGQISRQSYSYRQGLVLGLTMAEIMLLLVFCLLIALATFLRIEQLKRLDAEARFEAEHKARIVAELAARLRAEDLERISTEQVNNGIDPEVATVILRDSQLYEKLKDMAKAGQAADPDESWRELTETRSIVAEAQKSGMSVTDVRQIIADATALKARGIDARDTVRHAEIVRAIQGVMPVGRVAETSPDDIAKAVERGMGGHRWPPIIDLSEAKGYYFKSGSAELTPEFRERLTGSVTERILDIIKKFDVDIIEVVGHTDERPIGERQPSTLDHKLVPVLKDNAGITSLVPADNAGLGLARAVSVVSVLRKGPLAAYKLIPLSGAQIVNVDESLALSGAPEDVRERRRIEIRLWKSTPNRDQGAELK
jgi:flagellar motor protein MotB